jgi:hypothetical protein
MMSMLTAEVSKEDEVVMNMLTHHPVNSCGADLPRMSEIQGQVRDLAIVRMKIEV